MRSKSSAQGQAAGLACQVEELRERRRVGDVSAN